MKKQFFLPGTLLVCALLLSACAAAPAGDSANDSVSAADPVVVEQEAATDYRDKLVEYGQLERLRMDIPADAPVAVRAASFTISAQEIDALAVEYQLSLGYDEAAALEKAQTQLIERHALYAFAQRENAVVSNEVLDALIADEQDSDETSPAEFKAFLKGFGGDEALYWQLHREDLRMLESIEAMKETARKVYEGDDFKTYYDAYVADIVASEEAEILQ